MTPQQYSEFFGMAKFFSKSSRDKRKGEREKRKALRKANRKERESIFKKMKDTTAKIWNNQKIKFQDNRAAKGKQPLLKKNRNQRALVIDPANSGLLASNQTPQLKQGSPNFAQELKFRDYLPTVENNVKINPDGSEQQITTSSNLVSMTTPEGETIKIDRTDSNGRRIQFDSDDNPFVTYSENEIDEYIGPSGVMEVVRKEELNQNQTTGWKALPGWQKGLIIGGALAFVGTVVYVVVKSQNKIKP